MAQRPQGRDGLDGFVLFNQSIMEDGVASSDQRSAPSMLSPLSGFSSGASSSLLYGGGYAHNPNARPAPPPHTATLRTNFTSAATDRNGDNAGNGMAPRRRSVMGGQGDVTASPDAAFQDFRTPAHAPAPHFMGMGVTAPSQVYGKPSTRNMVFILVALVVGGVVGALLKHFDLNVTAAQWIMTPGNLYVRAVQCVVVPLVFVNLVVATADIVQLGLGTRLGVRVTLLFLLSLIVAILQGIVTGLVAHSAFITFENKESTSSTDAIFGIQCGNGNYLEASDNGTVSCSATTVSGSSQFTLDDVNGALVHNTATTGTGTSLSDSVLAIIDTLVPSNIMAAFVANTLLSIVAFALPVGVTLARSFHGPVSLNPLLEFLREVNETLVHMAHWVLRFTPFAVLSLLAGSMATSLDDSVAEHPVRLALEVTGTLAISVLVHMLVVMPTLFLLLTRRNPFRYMRQMLPAYVYSLGCSSSMATLPLSLQCIENSREVPSSVMHFVLSLGTSLHMPGTAIYLAMMVHFMADVAGVKDEESATTILMMLLGVFMSTLAAAPIPSGALTVLITAWNMVFPAYAIPDSLYTLMVAADVLLDRLVTLCNVNSQAMLCRVLADQVDDGALEADHNAMQAPQYVPTANR